MIRNTKRPIAAVQDYKDRLLKAKADLPSGVGQQAVILAVIALDPKLDSLANSTRWRNAWFAKCSDPHITQLVEQVVPEFKEKANKTVKRLSRQKLKKIR